MNFIEPIETVNAYKTEYRHVLRGFEIIRLILQKENFLCSVKLKAAD